MKPMARYEPKYHNQLWLAMTVKDSHLLPVLQMKHIKFTFAEPIVGIQYVHDEVFPTGERELSISSRVIRDRLRGVLMDLHVPLCPRPRRSNELGGYYKITLKDDYYFAFTNNEIFVIRGYDDLYIVDALGNKVNDDKAYSDFDIDKVYHICK